MNLIDIAILVIIAIFGIMGVYWGFIRQVLAVVGLIAGIVLAGRYGGSVAESLASFIDDTMLTQVLGFLIVLVATSALASLLATLLRRFVGLLFLGWADHLIGGVLGVVQAAIICAVLLMVTAAFPSERWTPLVSQSAFAPTIVRLFEVVLLALPPAFSFATRAMFGIQ